MAGFFVVIQAAVMVLEVFSDDEDDWDNVLGITPLPRRRYYPTNRGKRVQTVPTATYPRCMGRRPVPAGVAR